MSTAKPKLAMSSGSEWLISGSLWYGAPGEHDAVAAVLLDPTHGLLAHGLDILMEACIGLVGGVHGVVHLGARELGPAHAAAAGLGVGHALDGEQLVQAALELHLVVIGHERDT